jgi:hypothetical protein
MLDPTEFGKAMAAIVREAQAPLLARIAVLEARQLERGEKGDRGEQGIAGVGEKGEKGDTGERGPQGEKGDAGPSGEKGEQGARGEAGSMGERGAAGEKGEQGPAGRDADPIEVREVVAELLRAPEIKTLVDLHVAEAVQKYFEANPVRHGTNGENGKPGERGEKGEQGTKGDAGIDGVGLAGAMIDRDGCLIVTTTKGDAIKLGAVVGKNGDAGKDGADFSNASIDYDGERTLTIRGAGGEIVKRLPIPMDAGYWRDGMEVEKGDIVTHAGNAWIAIADTKEKPCLENKDAWRLFARKGRDGVDGTAGRNLGPAPPVKLNA